MTADERLEKLLNRAGQTISDLPRKGTEASEPYPLDACPKANGAAWDWYLDIGSDMDDYDSTRTKLVLKQYILHLTDVIDRMKTALENVLGQLVEQRKRLETIANIAIDYDGYRTAEDLMSLIDEMRDIALRGVPEEVTEDE